MAIVPSRPLPPGIPADCYGARKLFEDATRGLTCGDLLHVNSKTCSAAYFDMLSVCLFGAAKYFVPFYVIHVLWNSKKALAGDKAFYKEMAYFYVRSVLFGAMMGSTFTLTSCFMVRMTQGFSYWTSIMLPGTCAGLAIMLEHIYRRRIVMNTFYNMALQYIYVRAQVSGLVQRTALKETAVFMAINSLLLYMLHNVQKKTSIFWFYFPERGSVTHSMNKKKCSVPHTGTCTVSAIRETIKYSALALSLQALRVFMSKGSKVTKAPTVFFREFISLRTLAGMTSIGGYVFLYKVVRCVLAKKYGSDRSQHSALAGLVAGTTYWLQPNTTVLTSAIFATIRLLHQYMPKQLKPLGQWPMPEILFAICNGILFHARCMDMAHCPNFIVQMMDTATQNRSKVIYNAYLQQVQRVRSQR